MRGTDRQAMRSPAGEAENSSHSGLRSTPLVESTALKQAYDRSDPVATLIIPAVTSKEQSERPLGSERRYR